MIPAILALVGLVNLGLNLGHEAVGDFEEFVTASLHGLIAIIVSFGDYFTLRETLVTVNRRMVAVSRLPMDTKGPSVDFTKKSKARSNLPKSTTSTSPTGVQSERGVSLGRLFSKEAIEDTTLKRTKLLGEVETIALKSTKARAVEGTPGYIMVLLLTHKKHIAIGGLKARVALSACIASLKKINKTMESLLAHRNRAMMLGFYLYHTAETSTDEALRYLSYKVVDSLHHGFHRRKLLKAQKDSGLSKVLRIEFPSFQK
jgi:hypothetical protein